ncbi:hemolysin III family protein [candidate division KSB1 bacterium]|nr:hemolysin III family protein [candidate division KSB1 bacterium]
MSNHQPVPGHPENLGEKIANSITHGFGILLSIAGLTVLVVFAALYGNVWHIVSFSIFGATLILMYLASTLYHSFSNPSVRRVLKILDHSAIFLLIAGTYTPFMLVNLRGWWGWTIFGIIWATAILGIVVKSFHIAKYPKLSLFLYIFMGWFCVLAFRQLIAHVPMVSIILLILGGLSYTLGVIFYVWHKMPYHHAVWHLFVLGGSILHYFSVLAIVI